MTPAPRIGPAMLLVCISALMVTVSTWAFLSLSEVWFPRFKASPEFLVVIVGLLGLTVVFLLASTLLSWRTVRLTQPRTLGRARLGFLTMSAWTLTTTAVAVIAAVVFAARITAGNTVDATIENLLRAATYWSDSPYATDFIEPWFVTARIGLVVSTILMIIGFIACWFMIALRYRRFFWIALDVLLVGGFIVVTLGYPLTPAANDPVALGQAAARVVVSALLALRIGLRAIVPTLALLERLGFRLFVAARHLRAKKALFIAANATLSILAVAVASSMLVTVLSVMGGFRTDLKRKILGNHAHVVVDSEERGFPQWRPVLEHASSAPGVIAATPYLEGEVMLSSVSGRAAAIVRGIDPNTVGKVTDLKKNLTRGKLEYLIKPERLLDPNVRNGKTIPLTIELEGEGISRILDTDTDTDTDTDALAKRDAPVLPGIVLGQEIARNLRLGIGDRVTVISPRGRLGPTGPIPKARPFRVAAIFYSGMYEYDMKFVYTELETAQRFLNRQGLISGVEVKVENVDDPSEVTDGLAAAFSKEGLRVQDWRALNRHLFGALALEKLAMFVTLGIAILVAGFSVFGTLTLVVREKTREIGVLKAMGIDRIMIVQIFLWEGFLIGVAGAALGLGFGFFQAFCAQNFGIRLNSEAFYIDRLPVDLDPSEFGIVGLCTIVICVLATILPAVQASRVHTINALKF